MTMPGSPGGKELLYRAAGDLAPEPCHTHEKMSWVSVSWIAI